MSAHWCPPCRHVTPQLVAAYEAHKRYLEEGGVGDFNANTDDDSVGEIEVIFVSFDSVKSEYDNYRNTMPWLSVPFANLHRLQIKDILSKKYSIVGIPALIIIDGNSGKLVSTNGRELYIDYFKGEYPSTSSSWGCILSWGTNDILRLWLCWFVSWYKGYFFGLGFWGGCITIPISHDTAAT